MSDRNASMRSTQNDEDTGERLNAIASFFDCSLEQVKSIDRDIVTHLNDKLLQFNELKSENIQITVTLEWIKNKLCEKNQQFENRNGGCFKAKDEIRKERNDTSSKFESVQREKTHLSNELESIKRKLSDLSEEKKEIQSSQQRTLKILDERLKELEMVKAASNHSDSECKKLRSTILELETKQQTYISNDLNSKSQLERRTQELNLLQSNKDWLEKELSSKINNTFHTGKKQTQ